MNVVTISCSHTNHSFLHITFHYQWFSHQVPKWFNVPSLISKFWNTLGNFSFKGHCPSQLSIQNLTLVPTLIFQPLLYSNQLLVSPPQHFLISLHPQGSWFVGDPILTSDNDISQYISGCKPHFMSDFVRLN